MRKFEAALFAGLHPNFEATVSGLAEEAVERADPRFKPDGAARGLKPFSLISNSLWHD